MLRLLRNKKAQNTMEYALLIAIVIGVFTAMQIYVRRGLQARIKAGTDNIPGMVITQVGTVGNVAATNMFGTAEQYEPYYIRGGAYQMSSNSQEGEESGIVSQVGGDRELRNSGNARTGWQTITGSNKSDNSFQ